MFPAHFGARLRALLRRAQHEGPFATFAGILRSVAESMLWLVLLPLTAALHLAGYRRLPILTERIGHLAAEVDCFLKQRALGELPPRKDFLTGPQRGGSHPG